MYEREFTVKIQGKDEVFKLVPLGGRQIGRFYRVLNAIRKVADTKDDNAVLEVLGTDIGDVLYDLVLETLKRSYPNRWTAEELEQFATVNLLAFMGPLIQVNMPQND